MQPSISSEQYVLDFTSRANERCALVLQLRDMQVPVGWTRGRVEGVIELIQRLTLFARYLPNSIQDDFCVDAQVTALAARIERRRSVSEKTIRNWTRDAKTLTMVEVQYTSQEFGGRRWNTYRVHFRRVIEMAGNGRKRPVTVTDPGAVTVTDPGAVTVTDPLNVLDKVSTNHSLARSSAVQAEPHTEARDDGQVVVSDFFDDRKDEEPIAGELVSRASRTPYGSTRRRPSDSLASSPAVQAEPHTEARDGQVVVSLIALGMSEDGAEMAIAKAIQRGLTEQQIDELMGLYCKLSASETRMTVGYLWRWLTGKSRPPAPKPPEVKTKSPVVEREEFIRQRREALALAQSDEPLAAQLRRLMNS